MCKKNIFYKYPLLYVWGLKWIHKNNFAKRYCYMASFVRKNDLVLEPGCGPATLAEWSEKDGTNDFKVEYFLTRGQLLNQIEYGFDTISSSVERETRDFGEDIIAVFFKDKNSHQRLKKQKFVSAIVPVFNEEKTVAKVVKTLAKTSLVNEVICINDGSTDKSLSIFKKVWG
ncbi:MAG TPA: hypothetical protein DCK79_08225 [Candidatus Atribacteria bacterium]|nr:hypothetical protein [Candidatus Atribacteria bacterium]